MELNINEVEKVVELWLSRSERENEELQMRLKPILAAYKRKKYLVALFCSGERNLLECTTSLLLHNRQVAAERDIAKIAVGR